MNLRFLCSSIVSVSLFLASATVASSDQSAPTPDGLRNAVRVTDVTPSSDAAKAGVQSGDLLLGRATRDDQETFQSVFDLLLAEQEYGPRGPVTLHGLRDGAARSFVLSGVPWGISGASYLGPDLQKSYDAGTISFKATRFAEAGHEWERGAQTAADPEAAWLLLQAAQAYDSTRSWTDSDRVYASALDKAKELTAGKLAIEIAWAASFRKRRQWDSTKVHYERAMDLSRSLNAELTRASILADFASSYNSQSKAKDALPLFNEAIATEERLAPGSRLLANALTRQGNSYYYLHKYDKADASLAAAGKILENSRTQDILDAALFHSMGMVAGDRGDLKRAREMYEKSMGISGNIDPNSEQWATSASSLGAVCRHQGDFVCAEKYLQAALDARRKNAPNSVAVASSLTNIGNFHKARGDFKKAEPEFQEALDIYERLAPGSEPVAGNLGNLGGLAETRGDLELAANYYDRSIELWSKLAPGKVNWAQTLIDRAGLWENQGNLHEAERCYERALQAPEWQATSQLALSGLNNALGRLYARENRLQEAADAESKSLAYLVVQNPGSLDEASAAFQLADIDRRREDWDKAQQNYQRSLTIREPLVPDTTDVAESLHGLGLTARHFGKKEEALTYFSRAVDAIDAQTSRLGGSELVGANFRASFADYYRDLVDLLISFDRNDEAFHSVERYRARILLNLLAQRDLTFSEAPNDLTARLNTNAAAYESLQGRLRGMTKGAADPDLTNLNSQRIDLTAERDQIIQKIRDSAPGYASVRFPLALDMRGVQHMLDAGTVLVSYVVEPEQTLLFVLNGSGETVLKIPVTEAAMRRQVEAFRLAIQGTDAPEKSHLHEQAQALYDLLLRPAEHLLAASDRLLIIPDGPLHTLPFAALVRGDQYLIEWKPLHFALSATLYAELKKRRQPAQAYKYSVAAFGDPLYGSTSDKSDGIGAMLSQSRSARNGELQPLPFSRIEAEQIAGTFQGTSKLFEGKDATEAQAKALGTDVRYIHFALHGLLDEQHPLDSALAFSTPIKSNETHQNGFLQAWELYQDVHWDADLVVLSACDSGLGKEFNGEGLLGLTRAVHYAGAHSVIASLWSVDDRKTQMLMTQLYKNLKQGHAKDEALRQAQLKLLQLRSSKSPYYWAAFTLDGDWQ